MDTLEKIIQELNPEINQEELTRRLEEKDFSNLTLREANLTEANLTGAELTGADLTGANLTIANLTGADFFGANLAVAILVEADLTGAYLTRANLTGANLAEAILRRVDLTGAQYQIRQVLSINFGLLSPELTLELMRQDAIIVGEEAFDLWFKEGICPFRNSNIQREFLFKEDKTIWNPGKPKLNFVEIFRAVTKELNIKV